MGNRKSQVSKLKNRLKRNENNNIILERSIFIKRNIFKNYRKKQPQLNYKYLNHLKFILKINIIYQLILWIKIILRIQLIKIKIKKKILTHKKKYILML